MSTLISQSHLYSFRDKRVMAMESVDLNALDSKVSVAEIIQSRPWNKELGCPFVVDAKELTPLPMRYYHGQLAGGF